MFKQIVILILLSLTVIMGMSYIQQGLQFILTAHDWISDLLREVFSGGEAGNISRQLLALLAIPMATGLIPAVIYWLAKHRWFPYFMEFVWVTWLVQTAILVMMYKLPGPPT